LRQKYWRTQNAQIITENIHKYLQQRNQAKLIAKQAKLIAKNKTRQFTHKKFAHIKNIRAHEMFAPMKCLPP
jgi:hypothetical protein